MAMAESAKSKILKQLTGRDQFGVAPTCYIGLLKSVSNGAVEPDVSAGYGRTLLGYWQNQSGWFMEEPTNGKTINKQIVYFPEATADWGTVTHFGLFTSASGGTPFLWGALSEPVNIPIGYVPLFRVGKLSISIE